MLHFLKGSIIRSFCNSQSSHLVLFNFFQKNKNKSWSIEFYFLQNQKKKNLLFLDKTWLKSSGWIAINWLLQKFLQMKRLIIALFFSWLSGWSLKNPSVISKVFISIFFWFSWLTSSSPFGWHNHHCFYQENYTKSVQNRSNHKGPGSPWPDPG